MILYKLNQKGMVLIELLFYVAVAVAIILLAFTCNTLTEDVSSAIGLGCSSADTLDCSQDDGDEVGAIPY